MNKVEKMEADADGERKEESYTKSKFNGTYLVPTVHIMQKCNNFLYQRLLLAETSLRLYRVRSFSRGACEVDNSVYPLFSRWRHQKSEPGWAPKANDLISN